MLNLKRVISYFWAFIKSDLFKPIITFVVDTVLDISWSLGWLLSRNHAYVLVENILWSCVTKNLSLDTACWRLDQIPTFLWFFSEILQLLLQFGAVSADVMNTERVSVGHARLASVSSPRNGADTCQLIIWQLLLVFGIWTVQMHLLSFEIFVHFILLVDVVPGPLVNVSEDNEAVGRLEGGRGLLVQG